MLAAERRVGLAEVAQDRGAQAVGRGAVERHALEALAVAPVELVGQLGRVAVGQTLVAAALDEEAAGLHVLLVVDEDAVGRAAVAPGAARLLVVALQVARHVVVDDEAHVGLVDAHAEGVRGHHDRGAVVEEVVLVLAPLLRREARVVARRGKAVVPQKVADLLDRRARRAVHDARLARRDPAGGVAPGGALAHEAQKAALLVARLGALDAEVEVRPVEPRDEHVGVAQAQRLDDVGAHVAGGGGGERGDGRPFGQAGDELGDPQVAGAEVLPPLRHAVRLVHRHERDGHALHELLQARRVEPLGGDIEQLAGARGGERERLGLLGGGEGAVEARRRDTRLGEGGDLVLHEGDERRDDDREPRQHAGRHLVDERLARTGGHDAEHVAPGKDPLHELALARAEVVVAEVLLEGGAGGGEGGRLGRRGGRRRGVRSRGTVFGPNLGLRLELRLGLARGPACELGHALSKR